MRKAKSCAVCEKITHRFLFKDKMLGIPICSRQCEYAYLKNLTPDIREQMKIVRYLDEKIEEIKKRNKIGWVISGFSLVLIVVGFLIADATLFIVGNLAVIFGTLSTRHFEDKIDKLTSLRKRIVI
jgi:hypothetical protein